MPQAIVGQHDVVARNAPATANAMNAMGPAPTSTWTTPSRNAAFVLEPVHVPRVREQEGRFQQTRNS